MNSRSAKNEMKPNRMSVAVSPSVNAMASTTIITHHALTRALRFSMVTRPRSDLARRFSTVPIADEIARNATMPPKTHAAFSFAVIRSHPRAAAELDDFGAGAFEESLFRLLWSERYRRAEAHRAGHGNRQHGTFWQAAVQVLEVHGHELHIRELRGEVEEATLERRGHRARSARAFGKDDQ